MSNSFLILGFPEPDTNMLQYSVTLLTTFIGWGRALSDCQRQALFLLASIF